MVINGKTPEQIRQACLQCNHGSCSGCPYYDSINCEWELTRDMAQLIERMTDRISKQAALLAAVGIDMPEDDE